MKPDVQRRLSMLGRLDVGNALSHTIKCRICGAAALFFDVVDFNKYAVVDRAYHFGPSQVMVPYFRCSACGLVATDFFDDWSDADFAAFVYNEDYVHVDGDYRSNRPRWVAGLLSTLLAEFRQARILDYGAGGGVFAEQMQAAGFHVENYDPFSYAERPTGRFDIITSVEVMEHSTAPYETLMDMRSLLADGGCILFTQVLQPPDIMSVRCSWWYAAPRNGHVSFYCDHTLARLAARAGLVYFRGDPFHAFCDPAGGAGRNLASQVGTALLCPDLGVSDRDPCAGWHEIEGPPTCRYRWSANDLLEWKIAVPPGIRAVVQARMPFLIEIRDGFAADCHIAIGGVAAPASVQASALFAEAGPFDPGVVSVSVRTPEPLAPAAHGQHRDNRRLGLAVAVRANLP